MFHWSFSDGAVVKNLPDNTGDVRDIGSTPGSGRSPGGWLDLTPVFLPGESHGHRSLVGYSLWSYKELDTTAVTWHTRTHTRCSIVWKDHAVFIPSSTDRHLRCFHLLAKVNGDAIRDVLNS